MVGRIVAGVFGLTFGGMGLTVLALLWGTGFDSFHSPPLIFRIFGSFIAIPFVALGFAALYGAFTGKSLQSRPNVTRTYSEFENFETPASGTSSSVPPVVRQQCPNCAAPRGEAEISPSGDVKCEHCDAWYNIYQA